jgi:hypothetical protein
MPSPTERRPTFLIAPGSSSPDIHLNNMTTQYRDDGSWRMPVPISDVALVKAIATPRVLSTIHE